MQSQQAKSKLHWINNKICHLKTAHWAVFLVFMCYYCVYFVIPAKAGLRSAAKRIGSIQCEVKRAKIIKVCKFYSPTPAYAGVTKGGNTPSSTVIPTFGPRKILILWVIPGRGPLCSCTMDTGLRRYDDKSIISLLKKSRHPDAGRGPLCSAFVG